MGLDPRWLDIIAKADPDCIKVGSAVVVSPAGGGAKAADKDVPQWAVNLPISPSTNNLYMTVHGRRILTKVGRQWKENAVAKLMLMPRPARYPVTVHWVIEEWVRANRDGGNTEKILVDAMVEAGVLAADDVRCVVGETWQYRPREGGVGMTVWWEEADPVPPKPRRRRASPGVTGILCGWLTDTARRRGI